MPYLLLTMASIFWGGNYIVGHMLVSNVNPLILSELRWGFSFLLLFCIYHKNVFNDWGLIKKNFPVILILSIFGQLSFPLCLYIGLQNTSSLNAAIYISITPCIVLLINRFIFKDVINKYNIIGVILSLIGVIVILTKGNISNLESLASLNKGDLWAMGAALSWSLYCSLLRKKNKKISGGSFVTSCSLIGAIILIPINILFVHLGDKTDLSLYLTSGFILGLVYLVIFPSYLSYYFWSKGISIIGATRGEIYTHIIPLSAGIMSVLFLHVNLDYFYIISIILIVIGVYFCSKHPLSAK